MLYRPAAALSPSIFGSVQKRGVHVTRPLLPEKETSGASPHQLTLRAVQKEVDRLEQFSEPISIKGYATYRHTHPSVLLRERSPLLDLYQDPVLRSHISHVVGRPVHAVPIEESTAFAINCKVNYYSDEPAPLQWHYDRFLEYAGDTVVCVFTVYFKTADAAGTPIEQTQHRDWNTLAYIDATGTEQRAALVQNCLSVHLSRRTFHKVLPLPLGYRRAIFIMKFATDPAPSRIPRPLQNGALVVKNGAGWVGIYRNHLVLLLILFFSGAAVFRVLRGGSSSSSR